MRRDIREKLGIKIAAICLLLVTVSGAALSFCGMLLLGSGNAIADSYYKDALCIDAMESAMYKALWYFTEDNDSYYADQLITKYQGISIQIYDGEPERGVLIGTWGQMPEFVGAEHAFTVEYAVDSIESSSGFMTSAPELTETDITDIPPYVDAEPEDITAFGSEYAQAGYYTVRGYLPRQQVFGSFFHISEQVFCLLQPLAEGGIVLLFAALLLTSVLLLVYLLCSAGHRPGHEKITPNWQDRIPLDVYLCVAGVILVSILALGIFSVDSYESLSSYLYFHLTIFVLCILVAELIVLAMLMTLATRFKLGKWWRNTLCYLGLRWCWRLWKAFVDHVKRFFCILPMTWRTVLLALGVLGAQTLLTLLMFESYNGGLFFLLALVLDAALVVAAAWLSRQLQMLQETAESLARGDLEVKTDATKMYFDCRKHAEHLNAIGVGMTRAVEQRLKSERLKTELITNVSHDIKTPLTSIVNYVDLLKKEELPETAAEYVAVLDRQSNRLKKLTEDLVEASKASTGNVSIKLEPILVNEIIHQAIGDYNEKLTAGKLEVIVNTYAGNVTAMADGRLLWRVLDNLLNNICKYALSGTRVYINLENREGQIWLSMKNISRDPLCVKADELTERFVRGDESRHTEGSGLGLNIAQSLMELMGGTFRVSVDGDLFKAEMSLPIV